MIQYITTLSKYFITIFMLFYTLSCFMLFRHRDEKGRRLTYIIQIALIVLIQFSCFMNMALKTGDTKYIYFYAILQISILAIIEGFPLIYSRINRLFINNAGLLLSIGIIMLARLDFSKAIKQLIIVVVSFAIAGIIPALMMKFKTIPNYPYVYAVLGLLMLMAVYTLGSLANGSKLSLTFFGLSFQASEFVKILFVLFLAGALSKSSNLISLLLITIFSAVHVFLLVLSRDLGAALIFFVVFVLLVFIATRNYFYLLVGSGVGAFAAMLAYRIFRHVQVRVQAFVDPFSVIDNEGYQITQSLFALGSGNWFGLGLFEGTPETIPYVETDFIFSAISEEFGIIFSICMILICLSCFLMFINISVKFKDKFYKYIACGLGITYIFQVFLTIGGGTKFIPLTGVTLPFVSYGGSSVMSTILSFFVLEGMYIVKNTLNVEAGHIEMNEIVRKQLKHQSNIIMLVSYVFIGLFIWLSTYLSIYVATHEEELINNAYNPRQEVLVAQNTRGTIYSRNMDVLAETIVEDGKEKRYYPYANIFSHIVGYPINGKTGIEAQTNYYLINSNQPMSEKVSADIAGEKYEGDSVVTTLNAGLQKTAYTSIGSYNGAVVVSNPKTGEIYAMVSKPDFNPNDIEQIWDDLLNDKESSVLLNRATQGLYPPGSCFKIITLLEYIQEHPTDYNNYSFTCVGELKAGEGKITCFEHNVHNTVNLKKSLAISCNSSFGNIGLKLDRDAFQSTLDKLLFNTDLPLTMNYSSSSCVVNNDLDDLTMVRTAFGQGDTLMTPMHLNLITNAIANDGVLMTPYVVDYVVNCNNTVIKDFSGSEYGRLMSAEDANIVTDMMEEVIKSGTGKKLKNSTYTVAGKTGSAEYRDNSSATHSWFTGFAPADDPEISVTIILEDAGVSNLYAVPMAKKIFDEYFRQQDTSAYVEGQ